MATVILFNAARQQEIEDGTVTSGLVDVDGHLILTTRGGTDIDAGYVVGPPADDTPPASETVAGIAKIADDTEAAAGTDDEKIMTPQKVKTVVDAATPNGSDLVKGLVEFADNSETLAGTADDLAVTPAGLEMSLWANQQVINGTITGISSLGITVDLDLGLGTITADVRMKGYAPHVGDFVRVTLTDGQYRIEPPATSAKFVRIDLPLTTNWIRYSHEASEWNVAAAPGPYRPPYAYKMTNGIVKLSGLVKKYQGGAFASGEKIAILPVGFRPDSAHIFYSQGSTGGTVTGSGRLVVDTDGSIYALDAPADSSFVSLESIIFPIGLTWLTATLLNSFTAFTSLGAIGAMPAITLPAPSYAQDSNGITWTRGAVTRTSDPADNVAIFTYPNGFGPVVNSMPHWRVAGHTSSTAAYTAVGTISATNRDRRFKTGSSSTAKQFLDGTPFISESSLLSPYGATAATLQPPISGSSAYTSVNVEPRAYKTPEGLVMCHGLHAIAGSSGLIGVIHPDLRPLYKNLHGIFTTGATGRTDVRPTGTIFATVAAAGWTSVDNLHWMADAGEFDVAYAA